jgi:hypothetical protein
MLLDPWRLTQELFFVRSARGAMLEDVSFMGPDLT